ncbi:hypothetical protein CEXT_37391 [Caerostris extrusa]|uniref:Uncharacterized protein n=1 Tax=Caerostris extrusa TaxID=172846 RepID=A0AAV4RXK3_CAEEX|nr:hypothetical protein CEXT_37391 [Caerostris extrusa]
MLYKKLANLKQIQCRQGSVPILHLQEGEIADKHLLGALSKSKWCKFVVCMRKISFLQEITLFPNRSVSKNSISVERDINGEYSTKLKDSSKRCSISPEVKPK